MSGQACTYVGNVLDACSLRPVVRLVAFVIADHANSRDHIATCGMERIARRAGVTEATARRAVSELAAAGVFRVTVGGGRGHTNGYQFPIAATLSPTRALPRGYPDTKPARWTRETRAVDARNPRGGARGTVRTDVEQCADVVDDDTPAAFVDADSARAWLDQRRA